MLLKATAMNGVVLLWHDNPPVVEFKPAVTFDVPVLPVVPHDIPDDESPSLARARKVRAKRRERHTVAATLRSWLNEVTAPDHSLVERVV